MTQQDTQPPAETLAEATRRVQFEAEFQRGYGSDRVSIRRDDADTILAALTRRAGGDAIPAREVRNAALIAELRNPWEGLPEGLGMKRGECPQWARDLMQRAADRLATPKPPAGGDAGAVERVATILRDSFAGAVFEEVYRENGQQQVDRHDAIEGIEGVAQQIVDALALPAPAVEGDVVRDVPELIEGEPCTLADCPPGLFRWEGALCFKSEYHTRLWQPDAYVVPSGEYFWGGATGDLAKRNSLIVTPLSEGRSHG